MKSKRKAQPRGRLANRETSAGAHPAYEELLHFFNASPDLLCIAGFNGIFKRLNPAWQPVLGWRLAELQARPFLRFVHPDDQPATLAEMEKLAAGAVTITFENRYRCKDGSWKWLQWTSIPLPDRQEIYAIARDITDQKRLEAEIIQTLDRERERIGRELHDGLCQEMAGIGALSAALARKLSPASAPESAAAREIGKLLALSIRHARDLARGFIPLHREAIGLIPALADFCSNTEAIYKIRCRFHYAPSFPKLDPYKRSHLYRIAQEAVNNAITHGRASRIEVSLGCRSGQGTLTIRDNGIGLGDPLNSHPGIGLRTMADRARLIGTSFAVNRRTRPGTAVRCVFPLASAQPNP